MDKDLIDQYRTIHGEKAYGDTSIKNLPFIRPLIYGRKARRLLDYGCGQSNLFPHLRVCGVESVTRYDPAIPELSSKPEGQFDMVLCTDVLEHIEEADVDEVIADIRSFSEHAIIIVDTVPARQILPNGRNAHVSIFPKEWWRERLLKHYRVVVPIRVRHPRRAAFVTWPRHEGAAMKVSLLTWRERVNYRLRKVLGRDPYQIRYGR